MKVKPGERKCGFRAASRIRRESRSLVVERLEDRRVLSLGGCGQPWEGAPWADGLQLVDHDISKLREQTIYLDFDGASAMTYHGPVVVEELEIPAFSAAGLHEQDAQDAIVGRITTLLNDWFSPLDVAFTSVAPEDAPEYSTVFVGGTDISFSAYGSFLGLAEHVDVGNKDRADAAFVFSDELVLPGVTLESLIVTLATVAGHEAAHLLGFAHAVGEEIPGGALAAVAHSQNAHQWITEQGYERFSSEFGDSSMKGHETDFRTGAYNEDSVAPTRSGKACPTCGTSGATTRPMCTVRRTACTVMTRRRNARSAT